MAARFTDDDFARNLEGTFAGDRAGDFDADSRAVY